MQPKKRKISNENVEDRKPGESAEDGVPFQVCIPVHVVRIILSFMRSNYSLLNSFGMANKSLYQLTRLNWKGVVKVTEENVTKIPLIVLKGLERLWFFSRVAFKKVDFVRILSNVNPLKLKFLSFEASQVTKSSSRNEYYLNVISKLKFVFPNCQHLTICYGVREDTSSIKWDFSTIFPNITTIESPAKINSSMMSQLPHVERILHGMSRSEVLSFLEMMESEHRQICDQVKYFHKNCVRETRTAFEVGRYGQVSPFKRSTPWGERQLKEPETFPACLEKTVKVFKNMERMDLSYSKRLAYWEREGIQDGEKLEYKIDVLCISSLSKLKILNFSTEYEGKIIQCKVLFPHDLRTVKSMSLTTIPYPLFFDHICPRVKTGSWISLETLEISLNGQDSAGFFDGGEEEEESTKLTERGKLMLDELVTKKDFPAALKYMKTAFSPQLALEFTRIIATEDKNVKIIFVPRGKSYDVSVFNRLTLERNLKDVSIKAVTLEMDSLASSSGLLGKDSCFRCCISKGFEIN